MFISSLNQRQFKSKPYIQFTIFLIFCVIQFLKLFIDLPPETWDDNPIMSEHYKFFQNKKCEYFPCHKGIPEEDFNCLFCYCPLYTLGKSCGGNCEFLENGIKSCMNCGFPHQRNNYDKITSRFQEIAAVMAASEKEDPSHEM